MKNLLKEKTTIAAIIGGAGLIVLLVLLAVDVLSAGDFSAAAGAWAAGIVTIVGILAQDRGSKPPTP